MSNYCPISKISHT